MRRYFIFDKYNTWHDWRLLLTSKDTPAPEPKTNYIDLDGAHGTLDLSEALTGGVTYGDRTVTASFRTSEGTHEERVRLFRQIRAALHGRRVSITEPDDLSHYFLGRVRILDAVQDAVALDFTIEATCEPWRYSVNESVRTVSVAGETGVVILNDGEKTLCPEIRVDGAVSITANGVTTALPNGVYKVTDMRLKPGTNVVRVSGSGVVTFRYREAWL